MAFWLAADDDSGDVAVAVLHPARAKLAATASVISVVVRVRMVKCLSEVCKLCIDEADCHGCREFAGAAMPQRPLRADTRCQAAG